MEELAREIAIAVRMSHQESQYKPAQSKSAHSPRRHAWGGATGKDTPESEYYSESPRAVKAPQEAPSRASASGAAAGSGAAADCAADAEVVAEAVRSRWDSRRMCCEELAFYRRVIGGTCL